MTVTTNEYGQKNLFAKEPQMVDEDYNSKGLFSPMQYREMYNGRWAMMGIVSGLLSYAITGKLFFGNFWSMLELLTYYVIVSVVFIGAPGVFFYIVFMPALQNTKGRMVGYKDHKQYGDSSIYENTPSDQSKFYLELPRWYIR